MENNIIKTLNQIKNYITVQQLTKTQLESTIDWLVDTINNHFNGIVPLDKNTSRELCSLFDGLSCDLAYGCYADIDSDIYDDLDIADIIAEECDVFQIGGICTAKNCAHCVNHSGFVPLDEEVK